MNKILGFLCIMCGIFLLAISFSFGMSALCVYEGYSGELSYDPLTKIISCDK